MPRLSAKHYLRAHRRLRRYWDYQQMAYGSLSATEQWHLHDFFQPTKDWTEERLLVHRAQITEQRPSLPHQAGRALAKLDAAAARVAVLRVRDQAATQPKSPKRTSARSKDRQVRVLGVVKPEIDTTRLARAIVMLAEQLAAKEGNQHDAGSRLTDDEVDHLDQAAS